MKHYFDCTNNVHIMYISLHNAVRNLFLFWCQSVIQEGHLDKPLCNIYDPTGKCIQNFLLEVIFFIEPTQ
jgi:hypothetical protein